MGLKKAGHCNQVVESKEPRNYEEAISSPKREKWKATMEERLQSHGKMEIWLKAPRDMGMKAVESEWFCCTRDGEN